MADELQSRQQGSTLILTLSNPGLGNALGPAIYDRGLEILARCERDDGIRSIVITGEGEIFCAGGNLRRLQSNRQHDPSLQAQSIDRLHRWITAITSFPKPVIAAVEGAAAGAGFSLVLACDLVVAAQNAVFVMAYTSVGLSPDGGASWTLSQKVPRQLATEWMLLGERISSERLHGLGVVNRLAAPGQALDRALELAQQLNERAPNSLHSSKALLDSAAGHTLTQQLAMEQTHFVRNLHHANAGIGIDAFLNRQKPVFVAGS